jgi:hypothetical protein
MGSFLVVPWFTCALSCAEAGGLRQGFSAKEVSTVQGRQ